MSSRALGVRIAGFGALLKTSGSRQEANVIDVAARSSYTAFCDAVVCENRVIGALLLSDLLRKRNCQSNDCEEEERASKH